MARFPSNPFEALFNLQRALDASRTSDFLARGLSAGGTYPPINVFRQGEDFVAVTELPGVPRDAMEVQVKDNTVRIAGRKEVAYGEDVSVHRRERVAGRFDRTITLPVEIDAEGVKAEFRNGVLALFLPRAEQDKPRAISIN